MSGTLSAAIVRAWFLTSSFGLQEHAMQINCLVSCDLNKISLEHPHLVYAWGDQHRLRMATLSCLAKVLAIMKVPTVSMLEAMIDTPLHIRTEVKSQLPPTCYQSLEMRKVVVEDWEGVHPGVCHIKPAVP